MRPPSMPAHPHDKASTSSPSLYSRLILADETSLSVLGGGTAAMEEFCEYWIDIQQSLQEAIANGTVAAETLTLACKVATRAEHITDTLITLYEEVTRLNASFSDMHTLFLELTLEDIPSGKPPAKHNPTKTHSLPAYIKPAYEWLLSNLHNPYPSKEVKRTISTETNTSITYIENWFNDVRKKIGWTTLLKSRFYSKRSLIVEAATRAFHSVSTVLDSGALPSMSEDFDSEFHQIEDNAKNLYADKLYESNLALKVVESASADLNSLAEPEPRSRRFDSVFSPSPSSSYSSLQSEESRQPSSRKRRSTRSPDTEDISPRSHKRTRYTYPQETVCNTPTSMPSPSLSVVEISSTAVEASPRPTSPVPSSSVSRQGKRKRQSSDEKNLPASPMLSSIREHSIAISNSVKRKRVSPVSGDVPSTPPSSSSILQDAASSHTRTRKRRLSDATGERPSKRPHNVPSAPRLQTVSDPHPISKPVIPQSDFDLWWSTSIATGQPITLGLPEPVATEPIVLGDSTIPLDISWNSGVVIPPTAPTTSDENHWPEVLQDKVGEIDSIFTDFLDPKVFEQQFNVDLFSQDINQNLFGFDSTNGFTIPANFAPANFQGASQDLGFASSQLDLSALPQFYNTAPSSHLPNPIELLQSLQELDTATAQYDYGAVNTPEDKSAKAAKIQRLREELMRLEAEVV